MLPEWKKKIIEENRGKKIVFVHTPKCAGSFVNRYCDDLGIKSIKHNLAEKKTDTFYFTVIRDPLARFESFLNYRLGNGNKHSFDERLHPIFKNKSISLNKIVKKMVKSDFQRFYPYKTLKYWSQNCQLLITIDELFDFFRELGYHDFVIHPKENVSPKLRGTFNLNMIKKLQNIYKKDIEIYQHWTRPDTLSSSNEINIKNL